MSRTTRRNQPRQAEAVHSTSGNSPLMRRIMFIGVLVVLLSSGCGRQLSGRYEAVAQIPRMQMPGVDPKIQRQMDEQMQKIEAMNRVTLEFDGSKVRMGTASAISEYRYRIDGSRLEVIIEAMGQKTTLPMTIEADGSITYLTMNFRKVE